MKILSSFIVILLLSSSLKAQNQNLPAGKSTIYVRSGKAIVGAILWRLDSVKVEYVLNGNLTDINTTEVSKIETQKFWMEFDETNHFVKKEYDIIVLTPNDTLRGFIVGVGETHISYLPMGSNKRQILRKGQVRNYYLANAQFPNATMDRPVVKKDSTALPQVSVVANLPKDSISRGNSDTKSLTASNDNILRQEKALDYHQSYALGESDAAQHRYTYQGWGGRGFLLGMTIGSPFLSLAAVNSKVNMAIPEGVDEKLYRSGYENKVIKLRAKKAATGAAMAKVVIIFIFVVAFSGG